LEESDEPDESEAPEDLPEAPALVRPVLEVLPGLRPWADVCAGVVLGGAIGDAMGHPTEFIGSVSAIRAKYGPEGVTRFELWWDRNGQHFAPYTDDTQMAEAVLRSLLDGRRDELDLDGTMEAMAERFVEWSRAPQGGHRAPGNACMSGCRALASGTHWSKAGGPTAGGCGSVMRAYPFGLMFAGDLPKAEAWAVAHSKLTHRDPIALAACAAMAVGVARLARGEPVRRVTGEMVGAACRYSASTAAMMATAIDEARKGVGPDVTLDRLRAWAAHEAIAAAVYLLERHPDDARAAILEGANTPGDSDSIATLAGSLVGARVGARGLPQDWVRDVERADELMALALEI
jgi:ADP-ribosylglycohydrolase